MTFLLPLYFAISGYDRIMYTLCYFFFLFDLGTWLVVSSFPDQGLNPDPWQ